jgi:protein phosphatase
VRENNEDYVLAEEGHGIFILADGMGGGPGGEVASSLAATTAYDVLKRLLVDHGPEEGRGRILADALAAAHSAIFKRTLADPSLAGMGTTLELVVVEGGDVFLCHVGDSRIYLLRKGVLRQITTDDNYAAVLTASGEIPLDRIPPAFRHILTQVVGASDELIPEIRHLSVEAGDFLLMCSDGLNEALPDGTIREIMLRCCTDVTAIPSALVDAANERGGPDNVSVVVIEPLPRSPLLLA